MMINNQQGFTLLEVLLAVGITALIGIGSSQLLSITANTKNELDQRATSLRDLQRVDMLVSRDFLQIAGREVKDQFGAFLPVVLSDDDYLVSFTRSGLTVPVVLNVNASTVKRSSLQRVAYSIRDHADTFCKDVETPLDEGRCFVRLFWPVLDMASDTEPYVQLLLDDISDVRILFSGVLLDPLNKDNNIKIEGEDSWPPSLISPGLIADLVLIKIIYTTAKMGELERLYEVPRYAFAK